MALKEKDIARLGASARAQVEAARRDGAKRQKRLEQLLRPKSKFDSKLESDFYLGYILPRLNSGQITACRDHETFRLWEKDEYAGLPLPKADFTPDYILEYANGYTEVVEVKSSFVRKKHPDYPFRRRLFIEQVCKPQGWGYREVFDGEVGM